MRLRAIAIGVIVASCDDEPHGRYVPDDASVDAGGDDASVPPDAPNDAPSVVPSFPIGDGDASDVACYPKPTACAPCDAGDCTPLDSAREVVSRIGAACATKTSGGGCQGLRVDVGAFGCATRFTAFGLATNATFVACVQDALAALDFRCVAGTRVDASWEAGPCGGP